MSSQDKPALTVSLAPLEMPRRTFFLAAAVIWAAIVAVQAVTFLRSEISVRDACGLYLSFAREAAAGRWDTAQSVAYPPAYGILTGLVSRALPWAADPQELAGRLINIAWFHVILACVVFIAGRLWSRRVALAALGLAGLNPVLLGMSVNVWSELGISAMLMLSLTVLVLTRDRLRWWAAAVLGLLGGTAALCRSEGILAPFLLAAALAVLHWRRGDAGLLRVAAAGVIVLAVAAAVLAPRVQFVYDRSGYRVHDIRFISIQGKTSEIPRELWRTPSSPVDPGPTLSSVRLNIWDYHPNRHDEPVKWALACLMGTATGWNPIVLAMAVWGLAFRRPLARRGRCEAAMGLIALPLLFTYAWTLYVYPRMAAILSPIASIFGALGLVALAEQVRARFARGSAVPWWARWSASLRPQLVILALILAGCSVFCILRAQRKSACLRYAGEYVLARYGPGRRIMSEGVEPAYYARGWILAPPYVKRYTCDVPLFAAALRDSRADFFVIELKGDADKDAEWCPDLLPRLLDGSCDAARLALPAERKYRGVFVYDAARLADLLAPRVTTMPAASTPAATSPAATSPPGH